MNVPGENPVYPMTYLCVVVCCMQMSELHRHQPRLQISLSHLHKRKLGMALLSELLMWGAQHSTGHQASSDL